MSIKSVMASNHLILCRPLLLLPSIFPSIRVFSNELVLRIRWPKYWSFSFSNSPSNEYSGLISFRMDWLDLLAVQGLSRVFSNTAGRFCTTEPPGPQQASLTQLRGPGTRIPRPCLPPVPSSPPGLSLNPPCPCGPRLSANALWPSLSQARLTPSPPPQLQKCALKGWDVPFPALVRKVTKERSLFILGLLIWMTGGPGRL